MTVLHGMKLEVRYLSNLPDYQHPSATHVKWHQIYASTHKPKARHCIHMFVCFLCMHILTKDAERLNEMPETVEKSGMRNTSGLIQPGIRSRQISPIINK